jgi:hypothetical protein
MSRIEELAENVEFEFAIMRLDVVKLLVKFNAT